MIYDFNAGSSHPLGKIRLRCRIGDLKSEVTCYIIDTDMSYNLLLGRPWIHANWIVPSTLHQCFKYVEDDAMVRTVFAKKQPFKGVKNHFTDALLYQEANKVSNESLPEDDDIGNEADSELEENTPATFTFKPIVACFNNPQCNNPIGDDDEWVTNENITFDYPKSVELFESVDNSSLHMSLLVLSMTSTSVECAEGSVFVVPPSKRSQSPIVFGRAQLRRSTVTDSSSDIEPPQFFHYARSTHLMMRKMGYNLQHGKGLFGKGQHGFL